MPTLNTAARLPQVLETINRLRPHADAPALRQALYPTTEPEAIGEELLQLLRPRAVAFLLDWDDEAQRRRDRMTTRAYALDADDWQADFEQNYQYAADAEAAHERTR